MVILLKRYRLGASPPACDAAAASRSFRSSRTTAASAVGLTCERAVRGARVSYRDTGTHALVAEPREHFERGPAEVRVQEIGHLLHSCVGMSVERQSVRAAEARTHHPEWLLAGLRLQRVAWQIGRACSGGPVMNYRCELSRTPPAKALQKRARQKCS